MNESNWSRLVQQLARKTADGAVKWRAEFENKLPSSALRDAMGQPSHFLSNPRVFVAKVGDATYELSSGDSFGRAPFELKVWDKQHGQKAPIAALNSRFEANEFGLSWALEDLFRAVNSVVESEPETVHRLLSQLEDLG